MTELMNDLVVRALAARRPLLECAGCTVYNHVARAAFSVLTSLQSSQDTFWAHRTFTHTNSCGIEERVRYCCASRGQDFFTCTGRYLIRP